MEKKISNYKIGYNFESIIRHKLNSSDMIVANEIKVTQGDCGIDLIATYKKNFVLIQYKSVEKPIAVQTVRNFESSIQRFPNLSLGIIVCDSGKIKDEKYLTFNTSAWVKSSDLNLKVCDERFIVETIINNIIEGNDEEEIVISNIHLDFLSFLNYIFILVMFDPNIWKTINYPAKLNYVNNIHHRYIQNIRYNTSQQIKKHGLIDETIEFFYMIIQKFNSVIGVRFMILSPENAKLCEAMCEEIISHINETTLQVLNEESFNYGEIYNDVDCFLNVLKYFEKYHDLSEEQSNEIYSIISNQYYQSKKQQEYYSESDDSDDSEKTKVINKGKQKEVIKKRTFGDLAELSKVNEPESSKVNGIINELLIKRSRAKTEYLGSEFLNVSRRVSRSLYRPF
ncbi:hypothetical protein C2G38_2217696 [Gigaspora rosea]|uniref:Restriction endonuclease type IV Mrr domain-containing protein n=1 Tax=Gigaspora rosea TaxID=44941 RepID=A0A397UAS7_9GLOM|nr:hypothetical protein C2G38_2217696 [Gigaspora rosea]